MAIARYQGGRIRNLSVSMMSYPKARASSAPKNNESSVMKGVGVSVQKNPIRDTKFSYRIDSSSATKVNILEKKSNSTKPQSVFRVDGPHKSPPRPLYPHFNINTSRYRNNMIYQSLEHKKISNVTYSVAKNYSKIGKISKVGGRALVAIAIVSDATDIYNSYKTDGSKVGKKTIITSAGVAGSWAGAIGGAKIGAAGGASVGTVIVPGLGTVIGGAIGGLVGGVGGSIAGRAGGEAIAKKAIKK